MRLYIVKQYLGVPNLRRSTSFYIFTHVLPGISLLTLRCFVAEVRRLFPENHQKKREPGKQRNTEPWLGELNENTEFSEISATCSSVDIATILSKSSAVPAYCLFVFALFFFLLWQFFLQLLILCLYALFKVLKQGQKMNIPKINHRT